MSEPDELIQTSHLTTVEEETRLFRWIRHEEDELTHWRSVRDAPFASKLMRLKALRHIRACDDQINKLYADVKLLKGEK
jgi:hypothetical protein